MADQLISCRFEENQIFVRCWGFMNCLLINIKKLAMGAKKMLTTLLNLSQEAHSMSKRGKSELGSFDIASFFLNLSQ